MKISIASGAFVVVLLASGSVLAQSASQPMMGMQGPMMGKPANAMVSKVKPTARIKRLSEAYGETKGFCCQMKGGCASGPTDGSKVCEELGGKAFTNSYCADRECVDP